MKHDVVLVAGDTEPSGLADMLQQFLAQTLDEEPAKVGLARRISGTMLFRAAEDTSICVKLSFDRERIEVADHDDTPNRWPSLTADFITTAHLTTGEHSPLTLVRQRKMRVRCAPWHAPFLLRVLRLMRVAPAEKTTTSRRPWWLLALLLVTIAAVGIYYFFWTN